MTRTVLIPISWPTDVTIYASHAFKHNANISSTDSCRSMCSCADKFFVSCSVLTQCSVFHAMLSFPCHVQLSCRVRFPVQCSVVTLCSIVYAMFRFHAMFVVHAMFSFPYHVKFSMPCSVVYTCRDYSSRVLSATLRL